MGKYEKSMLPEAMGYYEGRGLKLIGSGTWRTTRCEFHGGRETMRIKTDSGGFMCMSCGAKGGNVLDYHRAVNGLGFIEAVKHLGAYQDDGQPYKGGERPSRIPAYDLLQAVANELHICVMVLSDCLNGKLNAADFQRFIEAVSFIIYVAGVANA